MGVELRRALLGRICHVQHIVFVNNWWLCALNEAMARQVSINYLAGKRIFAPWTRKTHTRVWYLEKNSGGQGFSWSITRVDTKRVPAVSFSYQGLLVQTYIRCHGSSGEHDTREHRYLFNFPATPVPTTLLRALRNLMCGVVDLPVPGLRATSHTGNDSTATWMCHVLGPHMSGDEC